MMWSFALWGLCHIAVFPVAKNIVVAAAMIVLALVGAALQDRKKERLQPDLWPAWESKTSYVPFAARRWPGAARRVWPARRVGGVVVWLAATWAHIRSPALEPGHLALGVAFFIAATHGATRTCHGLRPRAVPWN